MHEVFAKTHELAQAVLSSDEYATLMDAQAVDSNDDDRYARLQIASRAFNDMMAQTQQLLNFLLYSDMNDEDEPQGGHCACPNCNGCGKLH